MIKIVIALFLALSFVTPSHAVMEEKIGHIYIAGGPGIISLGSVRVGARDWEFGLLNRNGIGLAKLFYKGNVYAGFGPAYVNGLGFYGAMGFEWPFLTIFSFRAEMNTVHSFNNFSEGGILAGFTVYL